MEEDKKQNVESTDYFDAAVKDLTDTTEPEELETEQPTEKKVEQGVVEPTEPTVELDGEAVPLSQIKAWKAGHMMQADYTRKTQELAREREQFNLERQAVIDEALYGPQSKRAAPVATDKYSTINTEEPAIEFVTPTEERLYRELQEIKGAVGSIFERQRNEQVREVQAKIDRAVSDFQNNHKELTNEQVNSILRRANEMGVRNVSADTFEFVYRGMMVDPQKIEKQAIEKFAAEQKKKGAAALESPAGVSPTAPTPNVNKMTEDELFAAMVRELQLGSG